MSISVIQGVLRIPAAQEKIRQKGIEKKLQVLAHIVIVLLKWED